MNIESTLNKVLNPVEKFSSLIGAGAALIPRLDSIQGEISNAMMGQVHMPNIQNFMSDVSSNPNYKNAAIVALLGYFGKDAINNSSIRKLAEIAEKAGVAYLVAGVAENLAYYSTHSDEGCRENGFKRPEKSISQLSSSNGYDFIRSA